MSDVSPPDQRFWQAIGWEPTAQQLQTFVDLQRSLREWNTKVNLTRLVEDDDYWINQILIRCGRSSRNYKPAIKQDVALMLGRVEGSLD